MFGFEKTKITEDKEGRITRVETKKEIVTNWFDDNGMITKKVLYKMDGDKVKSISIILFEYDEDCKIKQIQINDHVYANFVFVQEEKIGASISQLGNDITIQIYDNMMDTKSKLVYNTKIKERHSLVLDNIDRASDYELIKFIKNIENSSGISLNFDNNDLYHVIRDVNSILIDNRLGETSLILLRMVRSKAVKISGSLDDILKDSAKKYEKIYNGENR